MGELNPEISTYVINRIEEFSQIANQRKIDLEKISNYIKSKSKIEKPADLIFICTHNSRRSHMSQIWAQAAAFYYGIKSVQTYSGGTEATAFNFRAVKTMQEAGFLIEKQDDSENPVYLVKFSTNRPGVQAFSKRYGDNSNPQEDFCAVMTCADADEACPVVIGAKSRVSIPYEDPKNFDGTSQETEMYAKRCQQISREMLFVMSRVNQ